MIIGAKKVIISTPEKIAQINPKNIELWKKYLVGKNMKLSDTTKESYESDINQFLIFILNNYENKYLFDIDAETMSEIIEDYVAFCTMVLNNKTRRISRRLSSISSIYVYYKKKRKIKENPLDLIERPTVMKGKYEIKQTFLNLSQVELIRKTLNEKRDMQLELFFNVGIVTMARVNALSNIRIDQIDLENRIIERVIEKEGYEVTLFFNELVKEQIINWLKYREKNKINNDYLFITKFKGKWVKVEKSVMQKNWIKKIGKIINEPEFHMHDLRHSGSSLYYNSGMKLEEVSKLLNHRSTQVTQDFYLKIDYNKIKDIKDKYDF
jgi:integrase/recombinase XerC